MKYSEERKEALLKKIASPDRASMKAIAEEEGICISTLYAWCQAARVEGRTMPRTSTRGDKLSSAEKFTIVVETASLNEAQLGEYCRKRGLYSEQIQAWRTVCEQAQDVSQTKKRRHLATNKADSLQVKALKEELQRKEKALAETAALLVLRKKANAIWGKDEDE